MSFWGNKLGSAPPPAPQQRYGSDVLPRGMGSDQQSVQRAVNDYVSRLPGQQYAPNPVSTPLTGTQWQPKSAAENPQNVSDVLPIWHWQGKEGAAETQRIGACPNCHSNNYFSRSTGSQINTNTGQMVPPAPECFECGYPRQQGALAGSAAIEGPAAAARQGNAPTMAPEGTIGKLMR
jgi:hypothetical protein